MTGKRYAAIDVGGTEIKYGILEKTGRILEKGSVPTPTGEGGSGILRKTLEIVDICRKSYEICGVPISSTGVVDCEKGEIIYAGETVPNFAGTAFKSAIEGAFQLPCEVENDVNCAGLAEYISGAGQGTQTMVCFTVGTGIGGCAVIDGKVLHGASGSAMEIGYLPVGGIEFQQLGAASVLCEKVAARKKEPVKQWDGKRIFVEAKQGDPICAEAIDQLCLALGKGIAAVCYVLNPDTVVLGGGIMAQSGYLEPKLHQALKAHLRPVVHQALRLKFAEYGNDAGLIGALYHFQSRQKRI